MTIVERIKELCKEQRTTIAALERECGFANGSIRKWDKSPTTYDRLLKVANALNTTVEYLRGETDIKKEPSTQMSEEFPAGYLDLNGENKAKALEYIKLLLNSQQNS